MTDTVSQPTEQGLAQATSYTKSNAAQDSTLQHKTNPQELEHRYYQYLRDHQYASTDALVHVLRWYLPYFEGFPRVLDIGCGHGEFLQLLTEQGHDAVGIDIDPAMVATCRERGLTAYEGDAISWLQGQEAAFDAIFSSNVIEHLDAPTVQALIQRAHTALRPGGLLLIDYTKGQSPEAANPLDPFGITLPRLVTLLEENFGEVGRLLPGLDTRKTNKEYRAITVVFQKNG